MKKVLISSLLSAFAFVVFAMPSSADVQTIVDVALSDADFSPLVNAVVAKDLVETVSS